MRISDWSSDVCSSDLHALALAARGARLVINDLGGARDGSGGSSSAAQAVVAEIEAAGGEAIANGASVTDMAAVEAMAAQAVAKWGRVDNLVNNAGVLRGKRVAKKIGRAHGRHTVTHAKCVGRFL